MNCSAVTLDLGVIQVRFATGFRASWRLIRPWMTDALSFSVRRYGGVETIVLSCLVMVRRPRDVEPVPRYCVTVIEVLTWPSTRACQWKWREMPSAPLMISQNCDVCQQVTSWQALRVGRPYDGSNVGGCLCQGAGPVG